MSKKKEHSVMGLPRASGKRRWSGDDEDDDVDSQSPPKVLCTSPPYALCAEDVLPHAPPSPSRLPRSVMTETLDECEITRLSSDNEDNLVCSDSEDVMPQFDEGEEDENFIDDEEDKDSGFIDGNSIDNSSDDDCDAKGDSSFTSTSSSSQSQHPILPVVTSSSKEEPLQETDFQMSLAKVLSSSSSELLSTTTSTTCVTTSCSPISITLHESTSTKVLEANEDSTSSLTVTSVDTETSTVVTSVYQSSVPSSSYDLHIYQSADGTELYQNRPCTPSWSCTFYDGSQPTTMNKYMEISPNRSPSAQSIQCDENGKSYLELGSASPYPNNYSNECGNFTTTPPATYNNSTYSTPLTGAAPTYLSGNGYFNNRQQYAPNSPYSYHGSEGYNNYEEGGCSYGYINGVYSPHNSGRGPGVPNRIQPQRCTSPICDPTKTSPRPACYPQQRLSVLNLSMFKLNRFSRFPEPSLHRSVLICNTLRHIEREMEAEGLNMATILAHSHSYGAHALQGPVGPPPNGAQCPPDSLPSMPSTNTSGEGPLPPIHSPLIGPPLHSPLISSSPPPSTPSYNSDSPAYSHLSPYSHDSRDSPIPFEPLRDNMSLRPFSPPSPTGERHSLLTSPESIHHEDDSDTTPSSRLGEDRTEGSINWCSVLSLSSQTDLDSMNNNECHEWNNEGESSTTTTLTTLTSRGSSGSSSPIPYSSENEESLTESSTPNWKLPSLSADDVLKSFPEPPRRQEEDLDSIIKVLVGS